MPIVAALLASRPRCYSGTYKVDMGALVEAAGAAPGDLVSALAELAAAREVRREGGVWEGVWEGELRWGMGEGEAEGRRG